MPKYRICVYTGCIERATQRINNCNYCDYHAQFAGDDKSPNEKNILVRYADDVANIKTLIDTYLCDLPFVGKRKLQNYHPEICDSCESQCEYGRLASERCKNDGNQ